MKPATRYLCPEQDCPELLVGSDSLNHVTALGVGQEDDRMPDRSARAEAARALMSFADHRIGSHEFQDLWPRRTDDQAVLEIGRVLWSTYSDDVSSAAPLEERELYERCARFLRTDLPYEWPATPSRWKLILATPLSILTLGALSRALWEPFDMSVWPFRPASSDADGPKAIRR
jgi:hypothetical protein